MYLEIDEGFPGHRKTLRLCSLLRDPLAGFYMINLWTWACRSCKDGVIRGMGPFEIEQAAKYAKHDGKLCAAMLDVGFLDKDNDGNPTEIHDWMKHTGGAIARMDAKVKQNKDRREAARMRNDAGTIPAQCGNDAGQTRQDKTRPDKTSQEKGEPPEPSGPIRPRTSHDLIFCLKVAIEREQPKNGMWSPGGSFAHKEAADFLANMQPIEAALPEIERRILLFAKDPAASPWTVKKFCDTYNGIGVIKRADGRMGPAPANYSPLVQR